MAPRAKAVVVALSPSRSLGFTAPIRPAKGGTNSLRPRSAAEPFGTSCPRELFGMLAEIVVFFPAIADIVMKGGRVPARNMTDEAAALYLAFPGPLLSTSLASQLPEIVKPCYPDSDGLPTPLRVTGLGRMRLPSV